MFKIDIFIKMIFFGALVFIEYLSTTSKSYEVVKNTWDKANHFFAFFTLFLLFSLAYTKLNVKTKAFLLFLFGFQIEAVQHFLPFRDFSLLDIFADTVGICVGIFFYAYTKKLYMK